MKNISTIDERILQIIDIQCNGNKKKFSDMIGYAPQVISNIVSGRKTNPSFEVLNAILSTFDDFSAEWLVLGKGEMLKIQGVNQPEVLSLTENNIYLLELLKKNLKIITIKTLTRR